MHALAHRLELHGFVGNDPDGVFVEIEGPPDALDVFVRELRRRSPPLATVDRIDVEKLPAAGGSGFTIVASRHGSEHVAEVTADAATCEDCLRELRDPHDRRYRYPFVNCTNCGPRFTIVTGIPYDRAATTMAGFEMCPQCRAEYVDPRDRRFHAQPVCCPACGPQLSLLGAAGQVVAGPAARAADVAVVVRQAVDVLRSGRVLAVKGLGGYHLAVDAASEPAVARLRNRKHREQRPFAVMVASVTAARELCRCSSDEAAVLAGPAAPVLLLPRRERGAVAPSVAPGTATLGLLLPYTPLHHLLLEDFGGALVVTSGNLSDEPIAFADDDALSRLAGVADAFLTHNRPIRTRVDDSVVRATDRGAIPVRRSRGQVPSAVPLPWAFPRHVLGCGPELKNTFCLGRDNRAVLSHHIGDLENYETLASYVDGIAHLSRLFDVRPQVLAHDLHPEYLSTKWAQEQDGVELLAVQHHHAHIASCLADNQTDGPVIGVAFDGTGFGDDGTLWGGEFLVADLAGYVRVAHLEPVPMPGGAAAVKQPWRLTAAYLLTLSGEVDLPGLAVRERHAPDWTTVQEMARRRVNAPLTSSAGRLFDAVAALLGVRDEISYEGQAAVELEQLADPAAQGQWPVRLSTLDGTLRVSGADLVRGAVCDLQTGRPRAEIAGRFHRTLAAVTVEVCGRIREDRGIEVVALSGGVFQNVLLTRLCERGLAAQDFTVLTHRRVPPNDGGVSLGQAVVAGALDRAR